MSEQTNMLLMTYSKYFPDESIMMLKQKFDQMDESKKSLMYSLQFKDPVTTLILSLLVGGLGIDRFYIGDTGLGIAKLLTCGGCGIWTIVDYFLIMKRTKEKNFEKLMSLIYTYWANEIRSYCRRFTFWASHGCLSTSTTR